MIALFAEVYVGTCTAGYLGLWLGRWWGHREITALLSVHTSPEPRPEAEPHPDKGSKEPT